MSISEITATSQDIEQFYLALHKEVNTLLPAENLYIALVSKNKEWIEFPYYSDEKLDPASSRKFADGLTELAIKTAEPLLIAQNNIITMAEHGEIKSKPFNINYPENRFKKGNK